MLNGILMTLEEFTAMVREKESSHFKSQLESGVTLKYRNGLSDGAATFLDSLEDEYVFDELVDSISKSMDKMMASCEAKHNKETV